MNNDIYVKEEINAPDDCAQCPHVEQSGIHKANIEDVDIVDQFTDQNGIHDRKKWLMKCESNYTNNPPQEIDKNKVFSTVKEEEIGSDICKHESIKIGPDAPPNCNGHSCEYVSSQEMLDDGIDNQMQHKREKLSKYDHRIDWKLLIKSVKERPVLWNKFLNIYTHKIVKTSVWREVCLILKENFEEMAEEDLEYFDQPESSTTDITIFGKDEWGIYFYVKNPISKGDSCCALETNSTDLTTERSSSNMKEASQEITCKDKVHYLKPVETNRCIIDGNTFKQPHPNTDIGIKVDNSSSPRPEFFAPYLDISHESPSFEKPVFDLTASVKKNLFKDYSAEKNMNTIDNITLKPFKLQNRHEEGTSRSSKLYCSSSQKSFDVDYCLPPTSSDDESPARYSAPTDKKHPNIKKFKVGNDDKQASLQVENVLIPYEDNATAGIIKNGTRDLPRKKTGNAVFCPLCYEEVGHFDRHLERKHADDESVQMIIRMPQGSSERRTAIAALRKKGNFLLKNEKDKFRVLHNNDDNDPLNEEEYYPCVNCLGLYKKTYLWRHRKICKANMNNDFGTSNKHVTNAQTFLVTTGILGNFLNESRIKTDVFNIMRADKISYTAKSDPLICLYGESYLNKYKRKQMNTVASNRMREMARLKISIMKASTIVSLIDTLEPCHYDLIVAAVKVVCGYDPNGKTYKASSLALHFGTNLKFLCDVAKKAILTNNPLFSYNEKERNERVKQIKNTRDMISNHWCNDVSSLANKVLNEYKANNPKILLVTEDVKCLNDFIKNKAQEAYENLEKDIHSYKDYKVLIESVLVQVLIFNRKRAEEVQFLEIKSYKAETSTASQNELMDALTDFEKAMSSMFKRVVVFGKGSRPVPLLFNKLMQKYMSMILRIREETDIVPQSNSYLFANPGSADKWISGPSTVRKYAHMCGARNPETLTSTRFRKQIATILQIMNFEADEMEQIATFMGHTEKTHKEFYRMSEDIYQTAKVAKVLILLNEGKGKEFKGKSLAEIEITEDLLELEHEEEHQDEERKEENSEMEMKRKVSNNETKDNRDIMNGMDHEEADTMFKGSAEPQKTKYDEGDMPSTEIRREKLDKVNKDKKIKQNRHIWSGEEKRRVLTYFKKHVRSKKAPRKNECLDFISKQTTFFRNDDWVRIKTLVYNTYRQN